jgi:hypothetical protein
MHKESFIINCNTLLHVSTPLGHLQGELFVIVTLRLHFIVECVCGVVCVLVGCSRWRAGGPPPLSTPPVHGTQLTAHSHSTIKCNLSVTITKKFSLKMTQQGRNMYECVTIDDKTLFVHLLVISVFVTLLFIS